MDTKLSMMASKSKTESGTMLEDALCSFPVQCGTGASAWSIEVLAGRAGAVSVLTTGSSLIPWAIVDVDRESKLRALELIINLGYKLKAQGQWSGPDKPSPWENEDDANLVKNMMQYLETEHIQNWSLWWTL
jgi:hypothetical protein